MASLNAKFINTEAGLRASQACDRCRIKKTRCDGGNPCSKCAAVGFQCTVSDKLARRSFPKGYTVNLENKIKELEEEIRSLKSQTCSNDFKVDRPHSEHPFGSGKTVQTADHEESADEISRVPVKTNNSFIQINDPIDQIFNLDENGIVIGNDNLNFESQLNHLLINLRLPFLKITNSHNFLLDDPNSYLFHRSYSNYNNYHNKDLEVIYNPLTMNGCLRDQDSVCEQLPTDVYELFIKLVSNFKKLFGSKRELDQQITQYFLNYNTFVPIFEYEMFMQGYDAFHTMYPFMFTYDDATINGFNLSSNDYQIVNEFLVLVIQIYAMISMNDPSLNLNLLLNHKSPSFSMRHGNMENRNLVSSLYDFLPYLNVFHVSVNQLHTYLLFLHYSLITNNKEKSLVLLSLINSFIGILGVNLNCDNLFFSDLSLSNSQRRDRVKVFWAFKILLKCFNLKFGFKPTINTTVINPVTIDRYFKLTPEKLSSLLDPGNDGNLDDLFITLLAPSVEFLNLMNIVIPSSFSPHYYEYLKRDRQEAEAHNAESHNKKIHTNRLDWILNNDDGEGNDGNLNYNYNQFLLIDKNLSNWRYALENTRLSIGSLRKLVGDLRVSENDDTSLYYRISFDGKNIYQRFGFPQDAESHYLETGLPDTQTSAQLIKMQLNFHYLLIRSMNYLNFVIERELTPAYYLKIANISREVLAYFLIVFQHVENSHSEISDDLSHSDGMKNRMTDSLFYGLNVDEDGFVVNDFSARRKRKAHGSKPRFPGKAIPNSPFNSILNGLSLTMINFKKVIVLQMLYLLICNLKIARKGGSMSDDTLQVLNKSISLFTAVFINYQPQSSKPLSAKQARESLLFEKLINDEMKNEILNDSEHDTTEEFEDCRADIDWDDETMDEDLKYLKILKYIKYKTSLLTDSSKFPKESQGMSSSLTKSVSEAVKNPYNGNNSQQQSDLVQKSGSKWTSSSSYLVPFSPGAYTHGISSDAIYQNSALLEPSTKLNFELESDADMMSEEKKLANELMSMRNGITRHI